MGRFGWLLFQSDIDLDLCSDVNAAICKLLPHKTDRDAEIEQDVVATREELDSGITDQLFDDFRATENQFHGEYRVVILGALIMSQGAKIRDSDMAHLRELAHKVTSHDKYALPMFDLGFRDPGKAQFLAALDHYAAGTPRSFDAVSCFKCGQIEVDTGKKPLACAGCKEAYYCDHTCQKADWKAHKVNCQHKKARHAGRGSFISLNV